MPWQLISDSRVRNLPVSDRFIAYAEAYSAAATALCNQMIASAGARSWPNASVVLMLSAHAVELFIKGAVLKRDNTAHLDGHRIDLLTSEYRRHFPEPSFEWDIPFKVECLGIAEEEIEALHKSTPVPSILYRYPVQRGGVDWNGIFGFEPHSYLFVLEQMNNDFARIKAQLA